ncbi:hypothetical protein AK88_03781 [Plasmodium fragile]|uniref:Merozoite surface protein 3 n=1 Tax=Plasmodium fragile TaxID=5857 RepID=A0A0D9QHQ8_PLAFR|nr:uncharacterized protein AK88_03781 [Plasmodium fragile]KJP86585.1 hypothetical protein AK88_03781 [Plasmodium fragile]
MKKLLGVVLYFFVLHKHIDAKSGNLRNSDATNESVEKGKNVTNGWIPYYYLLPKGQTTPIAVLAAMPEKTTFRKPANMKKDVTEGEEGEENVNSLIQSGEANDGDFQFTLQIVEGADHLTDAHLEGGSSAADAVNAEVPTGQVVEDLQGGAEALLEQAAGHTPEQEPVRVPAVEQPQAADNQNGEAAEEAESLPVHEADNVPVEEGQQGTPAVPEQAVEESVATQPADASVPEQAVDESVATQPADASVPEPNTSTGSEVDSVEEANEQENLYHIEDEGEGEEEEMEDEEFEDDYHNVMYKLNESEGETDIPSYDDSNYLTRADIVVMIAARNMLNALNDNYSIMDFLTTFNPNVMNSFHLF